MNPNYPIYIISKGRWESRLTVKAFNRIGVPYRIVIEPQEFETYAAVVDPKLIHVLPFSNLGQGSIPARNWVWGHSISQGDERHWIVDDNIKAFYRFNKNLKVPVGSGAVFRAMENFVDRYTNVAMAGPNYFMFAPRKTKQPPFKANTRVYSCILLSNDPKHYRRWRGTYNEDTDLALRFLKAGLCTILFNAFLAEKSVTMTMAGGNTDELYKSNGKADPRWLMAESLRKQHPDAVKITRKWGRWQHHVDYRRFKKNKLIRRQGIQIPSGIDNFGMVLKLGARPRHARPKIKTQ